jgi:hypothetical protein
LLLLPIDLLNVIFATLEWNDRLLLSGICRKLRKTFVSATKSLVIDGAEQGRAFSSESVRVLLHSFKALTGLDIRNCNFVADNAITYMEPYTKLTSLKFANCRNITILALKSLVKIRTLRELSIDGAFQVRYSTCWTVKRRCCVLMTIMTARSSQFHRGPDGVLVPLGRNMWETYFTNYQPYFVEIPIEILTLNVRQDLMAPIARTPFLISLFILISNGRSYLPR